jgi:hypothetical protein
MWHLLHPLQQECQQHGCLVLQQQEQQQQERCHRWDYSSLGLFNDIVNKKCKNNRRERRKKIHTWWFASFILSPVHSKMHFFSSFFFSCFNNGPEMSPASIVECWFPNEIERVQAREMVRDFCSDQKSAVVMMVSGQTETGTSSFVECIMGCFSADESVHFSTNDLVNENWIKEIVRRNRNHRFQLVVIRTIGATCPLLKDEMIHYVFRNLSHRILVIVEDDGSVSHPLTMHRVHRVHLSSHIEQSLRIKDFLNIQLAFREWMKSHRASQ